MSNSSSRKNSSSGNRCGCQNKEAEKRLSQLDLYMEVKVIPPPRLSTLKRSEEEEEEDRSKNKEQESGRIRAEKAMNQDPIFFCFARKH